MGAEFESLFDRALGEKPFPFQEIIATSDRFPRFARLPTGVGKTEAFILGWLNRRLQGLGIDEEHDTPRRLVYCLPTRVLVEQTVKRAEDIIKKLGLSDRVPVYTLMGGQSTDEWLSRPEGEAMLIGTQDMLLSRALNRGFGMSRFKWPRAAGLLNNDALWVFDEVQLMGPGLATSAQLDALRRRLGTYGTCATVWTSATLDTKWLKTVDFEPAEKPMELTDTDLSNQFVAKRIQARKTLRRGKAVLGKGNDEKTYVEQVEKEVLEASKDSPLTIVVVNTVRRARMIHERLQKKLGSGPHLRLLHSEFRPWDRRKWGTFLDAFSRPADTLEYCKEHGNTILVATQVIEAGVNISGHTLFTELAPWPSIVQRIGRCNRFGEYPCDGYSSSQVVWLDVEEKPAPYTEQELGEARVRLGSLEGKDVSPGSLAAFDSGNIPTPRIVLRMRDVVETFDTTPDLSGNDIDVSRFIREIDNLDVLVAWREFDQEPPSDSEMPTRDELCPVPVGELRDYVQKLQEKKGQGLMWTWDYLEGKWRSLRSGELRPGLVVVLRSDVGGYSEETGWTGKDRDRPTDLSTALPKTRDEDSGYGSDGFESVGDWQDLKSHSKQTQTKAEEIVQSLPLPDDIKRLVIRAAWLHDIGKAHQIFQRALLKDVDQGMLHQYRNTIWAKKPRTGKSGGPIRYERKYFRHELAGALALLDKSYQWLEDGWKRDLIIYLVASHHGKVRLSIRSLPGEQAPNGCAKCSRGVCEGDSLPTIDLGDGMVLPHTTLSLEVAELGLSQRYGPSWIDRMKSLLSNEALGPFRLEYLEALVRAADARASAEWEKGGGSI